MHHLPLQTKLLALIWKNCSSHSHILTLFIPKFSPQKGQLATQRGTSCTTLQTGMIFSCWKEREWIKTSWREICSMMQEISQRQPHFSFLFNNKKKHFEVFPILWIPNNNKRKRETKTVIKQTVRWFAISKEISVITNEFRKGDFKKSD